MPFVPDKPTDRTSGFVPDTEKAQAPEPTAVQQEIKNRSFFRRPVLGAEETTPAEIAEIAKRHKVDPKELEQLAPYFGARIQGAGFVSPEELKRAAGGVGQLALGIPQKLYKKYRGGEMESALDELQQLAQGRQSYVQLAGEVAAPLPGAGIAKGVAGKIATGTAIGAVAGAAGAQQGREAGGALFGGALGGALSGVAARLASKGSPVEQKAVRELVESTPELTDDIAKVAEKQRPLDNAVEKALFGGGEDLSKPEVDAIIEHGISPREAKISLSPTSTAGQQLYETVLRKAPELDRAPEEVLEAAMRKELAQGIVEGKAREFASEALGETAPRSLEEIRQALAKSGKSAEALQGALQDFSLTQHAMRAIEDTGARAADELGASRFLFYKFSDAQPVLRHIDNLSKGATDLESVIINGSGDYNQMQRAAAALRKPLAKLAQEDKAGVGRSEAVYRALDTGDYAGLSAPEAAQAHRMRKLFDKYIDFVNGVSRTEKGVAPLAIPRRENYVPKMLVRAEDFVQKMQDKEQQALAQASEALGRKISKIQDIQNSELRVLAKQPGPMQELISGVRVLDNRRISSVGDLAGRLQDKLMSRGGRQQISNITAGAMQQREGEIPDFLLEKDVYKLANRWLSNTLRYMYMEKTIRQLGNQAKLLEKLNAPMAEKYVRNLISDFLGTRQGTFREMSQAAGLKYQLSLDKMIRRSDNEISKGILTAAKAAPDILEGIANNVYSNILGMSPRAHLQNLTQVFSKTAPELGGAYGYATTARGSLLTARNLTTQLRKVHELGLDPPNMNTAMLDAIEGGIKSSLLYKVPAKVSRGMSEAMMYTYKRLDQINRATTLTIAEIMAKDLAKGSKSAQKSLANFPRGVQTRVAKAIQNSNPILAAEELAKYLNASTQFNYNRLSMSEFGRMAGPLLSTFSKWPTATVGDMAQEVMDKGLVRGSTRNVDKYAIPLGIMYLMGKGIHGDVEDMSDREKKLFGSGGLVGAAPIMSAVSVARGDLFSPPIIDVARSLGTTTARYATGEAEGPEIARRVAGEAIRTYAPGAGLARFLLDDLVTLGTGERPEGDFFEKSAEGAKQYQRIGK